MKRALCIALLVCAFSRSASAEVKKYALVIGHNRGEGAEVELAFAEADARRVASLMERLGGVRAEDSTVMLGRSADEVQRTLITLNDRIRQDVQDRADEVLLFVYYSGHADADALHLGGSLLPIEDLRRMVRGSAAKFRVLILDACKSGALTRVKGGRPIAAFEIGIENELEAEGTAFITSSAADEDSQESDAIGGSFFTHYLASGLLGAADDSDDRRVSLAEAYRYAHDQTVKATSRTWAGTQHPTFQYDLKGKGDVVLVDLALDRPERAGLLIGGAGEYLVFRDDGVMVAEVVIEAGSRRLLLEPGRYFVRERRREELREGTVVLSASQERALDTSSFERIQYARLVRKGSVLKELAHGPTVFYRFRGEILDGLGGIHGFGVGYQLSLPWLTFALRFGYAQSSAANTLVSSTTRELDLSFEALKAFDLWRFTFAAGLELGGAHFTQRFVTPGLAPDRDSFALVFGAVGSVSFDVAYGFWIAGRAEGLSYVLKKRDELGRAETGTPLTFALGLGLGVDF